MKGIAVLGATGSVGVNTLDVIARHPDRYRAVALGAHRNVEGLFKQIQQFRPAVAALTDSAAALVLEQRVKAAGLPTAVLAGPASLETLATLPEVDQVMAAVVGAAGLRSTLAAARAGKRLLLANKESLVMSGPLLLAAVHASGAELLPIDSEHNAIFQCLPHGAKPGHAPEGVRRILLTASGGPFRDWSPEAIASATPDQACKHPNWVMGRKISVDSASLMNKGLELIEACFMFGLGPARVEVVVHPQSVVHSMVEYIDGSVLAQLACPDMRTPIAYGLAWPERIAAGTDFLDLVRTRQLDFLAPDTNRFPCLALARAVADTGGLAPAILNAANEVAVTAFLEHRLNFPDIPAVIECVLAKADGARAAGGEIRGIDEVLQADAEARELAQEFCRTRSGPMRSVHA
ncbi:MAG TPA: 1-deoxy-D-xylulose-5-phosphate reductoisomerase [Steroidobacteraceae bacterium]|jgi:1-deoxy-D-xylulose-5-phosphate reductoisomerase|nr:1-deoxy-D-xylulose-5-phosphate reductoisomerase [Steroidobacteraceae bacterium]